MVDSNPDSTAEFGEINREWTGTTLDHPENNRHIDQSGDIGENDDELSADLADAADIEEKFGGNA